MTATDMCDLRKGGRFSFDLQSRGNLVHHGGGRGRSFQARGRLGVGCQQLSGSGNTDKMGSRPEYSP